MRIVVKNVYKPEEKWGSMTSFRQHYITEMVRAKLKNVTHLLLQYLHNRIAKQMEDKRNNERQIVQYWVKANKKVANKEILAMKCSKKYLESCGLYF